MIEGVVGAMDEPVDGRRDGHGCAGDERARARPAVRDGQRHAVRMLEATEATPEMAAYFLGALRDQSSRAGVFQRQLRWQRLRHALTIEQDVVAQEHQVATQLTARPPAPVVPLAVPATVVPIAAPAAEVTTCEAPPEPTQAAAG